MTEYSISKKIDETVKTTERELQVVCPPPKAVKIELTRKCNYKCSYCFNKHLKVKDHMPKDKYLEYITKIHGAGVKELGVFFFGESFIVPWLPEAIKMAKDVGFEYVFLTTNGALSTPEKVKACMDSGLQSLKFSLNFADEKQFEEVAGVAPKNFHNAIANIKAAKKIRDEGGYKCGLYASYIEYTGEQKEKMDKLLTEIRPYLDEVYALPLYDQGGTQKNNAWEFTGGNSGRAANPVAPVPCWTLFREGHVNFDGTMNACCFGLGDQFTHGNLNTESFMDAWNSLAMQKLRTAHLAKDVENTPCRTCVKKCITPAVGA